MRKPESEIRDIELCKREIQSVLSKYNCELMDVEEGLNILLRDRDTFEVISATR